MADENRPKNDAAVSKITEAKKRMLWVYGGILSIYYLLGIVMYMFVVETWSFTDTLYFITVTLTTAGFGVLVPTNDGSRAFTTLFICVGLVVLAVVLTDVFRTWSEERERLMNQIRARAALGKGIRRVAKSFSSAKPEESDFYKIWKNNPVTRHLLKLMVFVLLFAAIFVSVEESINYGNCLYFTVVAATTVGYGDVHPNTTASKWVIILLLPPSVYLVSSTLSDIASFILDNKATGDGDVLITDRHALDAQKDLSANGLLTWSKGNSRCKNGAVTEVDFLHFILSRSHLVEEEVLLKLRDQFAAMDESGAGIISKVELEHLAEESQLRSFEGDRCSIGSVNDSMMGLQPINSEAVIGNPIDV